MKVGFLRKIPIGIASLLASSTAFAAMDIDSRVSQLENQMQQVRTETAMGTYGAQTATARPEVDGRGWYVALDVIYWHARVGGTNYAYTDDDPVASFPIKGRTKNMEFEWDWGLRAGLGYNFKHDGWDVFLNYTWFDSSGSNSTNAGLNNSVVPLKGSSTIVQGDPAIATSQFLFCTSAKSQYDINYQSLDLELGRAYFVSGQLSFRPHWGLRSAWIDQSQVVRYTGGDQFATVGNNPVINYGLFTSTVKVKDENEFWGLGPRTGVQSKWHLGNGFSIFGNVAASLLYGNFEVNHKESWTASLTNYIKLTANRHAFSPNVQFQLGLRYDKYIHNNKQHFGIGLGYEAEYWWRQNQMLKIDDAAVLKYQRYSEDVAFHGITLDLRLDF